MMMMMMMMMMMVMKRKILRADPELWVVIFLGLPFSGRKWPICPKQIFFGTSHYYFFHYVLSLLIVQNLKKFLQQILSYGPFAPNNFF